MLTLPEPASAHSAGKHGISKERSRYVVERATQAFSIEAAADPAWDTERLLFLGDDRHGVALEVMGIELDDGGFLIIHAMKMRRAYRRLYRPAMRDRAQ